MRKNIIALMLALPLLFVFVVFSSGSVASLGVPVAATGIEILGKPQDGAPLRLDLVSYENDYTLNVKVLPANASDKSYTFRFEEVDGSEKADIEVDGEGHIVARSPGAARIVAVSGDGGFTDSLLVSVGSSKAYDFDLVLKDEHGDVEELTPTGKGYSAEVPTGRYRYSSIVKPAGFAGAVMECEEGFAVVNEAAGSLLFPFSGNVRLKATVEEGWKGAIEKELAVAVTRVTTASGFTVNGSAEATLAYENGTRTGSFYVEGAGEPTVSANPNLEGYTVAALEGGEGRYKVDLTFAEGCDETEFTLDVGIGAGHADVTVSFQKFAFEVRADLPVQGAEHTAVLLGVPTAFYAYPSFGMEAEGVTYAWTTAADPAKVVLTPKNGGSSCIVQAAEGGTFKLTVQAMRGANPIDIAPVEMDVEAVRKVTDILFWDGYNGVDLAKRTTIAGYIYEGEKQVSHKTQLNVEATDVDKKIEGFSDFDFEVSDPNIARIERTDDAVLLVPKGTGEVTITASWHGNESFGTSVRAFVTFNVVHTAVEVTTSKQLYFAAERGKAVVLGKDIMLGTNDGGEPLPEAERRATLAQNTMRSTYNIDFYTSRGLGDEARIKYAIEFKNDVYGNGHTLNAEYFTNVKDGSNSEPKEGFFRGPLYFVSLGETASVAGQDNIAFLIRTDGVTLHGLTLLGCNDSSLLSEETGENDISNLNNVGTTVEINANAELINCRVRNGRNVVRAYGGNRNGERYFIDSLDENEGCDNDRIHVRIEGCILSNAREFILKIGANRALRSQSASDLEPSLLKADGTAYKVQTNDYLEDAYFYERYVMTDVTLKDSVLETSGLFTVGIESNFAGAMLGPESIVDGWKNTGGTSFASILRLEGDVRLYDWKRLDLVDSSTLIETKDGVTTGSGLSLRLDIAAMLNQVCAPKFGENGEKLPNEYEDIILERDGKQFVHGGIAFYGGGKNYAQLSTSGLAAERKDFSAYHVNISILKESEDNSIQTQGQMLPAAAGTQDFRFYMYGNRSSNSYDKQLAGPRYDGIAPVPLFL